MTVTFIVTAPLVVASDADGRHVYVYQGSPVPAGVTEAEIARLVEGSFVVDATPAEAAKAEPEPQKRGPVKRASQD